jgi:hypothetical protein
MNINNLLVLPLKFKFEPDSWEVFWKVWERDTRLYHRKQADAQGNNSRIPHWEGFIWKWTDYNQTMWDVKSDYYHDEFPKLKQQLQTAFPCTIDRIMFQSNITKINPHRDGASTDNLPYPASLRVLIYDENDRDTFYICNDTSAMNKKYYVKLPADSNTFVYNNPKVFHGADLHNKRKILMHIISRDYDEEKWFKLLRENYGYYKDQYVVEEQTWT